MIKSWLSITRGLQITVDVPGEEKESDSFKVSSLQTSAHSQSNRVPRIFAFYVSSNRNNLTAVTLKFNDLYLLSISSKFLNTIST